MVWLSRGARGNFIKHSHDGFYVVELSISG